MMGMWFAGNLLAFLAALVFFVALLSALVKIAYELGKDDGWDESARWVDAHAMPSDFADIDRATQAEDRPASRFEV
jgi:hypothetical protein